jgi:uncharacterized membrane protein YciS (DUF1049 family)
MKRLGPVFVIVLALFLVACATLQNKQVTAYKVLASTASLYDSSMKTLATLYAQGLITDEEKIQAIRAAEIFWAAWHEAEIACEIWMATETEVSKDRALALINQLQARFTEMMEILKPLLVRASK